MPSKGLVGPTLPLRLRDLTKVEPLVLLLACPRAAPPEVEERMAVEALILVDMEDTVELPSTWQERWWWGGEGGRLLFIPTKSPCREWVEWREWEDGEEDSGVII